MAFLLETVNAEVAVRLLIVNESCSNLVPNNNDLQTVPVHLAMVLNMNFIASR